MRASALLLLLVATNAAALNAGLGEPPEQVNRETPLQTWQGFLQAAHAGDYATAEHYLYLDYLKKGQQLAEGQRLARRLKFVIDRKVTVDVSRLSTDPNGDPADMSFDQIAVIPVDGSTLPIRLARVELPSGEHAWVFGEATMRSIDRLYDEYGPPFGEALPEVLFRGGVLGIEPWQWIGIALVLALATVLAVFIERTILAISRRMAKLTQFKWDDEFVEAGRGPLRLPFWGAIVAGGTRFLLLPPAAQRTFDFVVRSLIIVSVAWFLLRFFRGAARQLTLTVGAEGQRARGIKTQVGILQRILEITVYVVSAALLLLQFEVVRNVGVSLLASAGIAGLVVGLAAQKSIGALLAGIQLSLTQPIRIGDSVVIEGEFGTIEEITLTYVVVQVWDLRRLVIPVSYFLDKPFQNWSRGASDMLGTVNLELDYRADIAAIRAELKRLLDEDAAKLWNGKTAGVQVTETKEKTMVVRVLVSAKNSGDAWDLRCLLREKLIEYVRRHPDWLPVNRTEARNTVVDSRAHP